MPRHPPNNIREFEACTHFVPRNGCEIGARIGKVSPSIKFTEDYAGMRLTHLPPHTNSSPKGSKSNTKEKVFLNYVSAEAMNQRNS